MKKHRSLLFIAAILIFCASFNICTAETYQPDDIINAEFSVLSNSNRAVGAIIQLAYDHTALELIPDLDFQNEKGQAVLTDLKGITVGEKVNATFKILNNAHDGEYEVTINVLEAVDINEKKVDDLNFSSLVFTVKTKDSPIMTLFNMPSDDFISLEEKMIDTSLLWTRDEDIDDAFLSLIPDFSAMLATEYDLSVEGDQCILKYSSDLNFNEGFFWFADDEVSSNANGLKPNDSNSFKGKYNAENYRGFYLQGDYDLKANKQSNISWNGEGYSYINRFPQYELQYEINVFDPFVSADNEPKPEYTITFHDDILGKSIYWRYMNQYETEIVISPYNGRSVKLLYKNHPESVPRLVLLSNPFSKESVVMSHDSYMYAEPWTDVCVETYVQATGRRGWEKNSIQLFAQSKDGGYYIGEMKCSKEDKEKLVPGTKILVKGIKIGYGDDGVEIIEASYEIIESDPFIAEPKDVSALLGSEKLLEHQNEKVLFKGLTVSGYEDGTPVINDSSGISFCCTDGNGLKLSFFVDLAFIKMHSDLFREAKKLEIGDVIDIEGFFSWTSDETGPYTYVSNIIKQ